MATHTNILDVYRYEYFITETGDIYEHKGLTMLNNTTLKLHLNEDSTFNSSYAKITNLADRHYDMEKIRDILFAVIFNLDCTKTLVKEDTNAKTYHNLYLDDMLQFKTSPDYRNSLGQSQSIKLPALYKYVGLYINEEQLNQHIFKNKENIVKKIELLSRNYKQTTDALTNFSKSLSNFYKS